MTRRGYGFVTTPEGDWFIPRSGLNGAMDADLVQVRPTGHEGGRYRGRIVRVIERATTHLPGTYRDEGDFAVVVPLDPKVTFDLLVSPTGTVRPVNGDVVDVGIISYPSNHAIALGEVLDILGHEGDPHVASAVVVRRHDIETEFSTAALEEAASLVLDVDRALEEGDRLDLRDEFIITIDPIDARDFDDAVSISRLPDGGFSLGVHIADVAEYVPWGSSIDLDARRRSTSTYLVDRVIPMLPEALGNGLCSLNPNEDRLAFTVRMRLDSEGELVSSKMHPSVIRSHARLDYGQALDIIEGRERATGELERLLHDLDGFAATRHRRMVSRGGIDFDGVEAKVLLDDEGAVEDIMLKRRTRATAAIEEAMICANETVAGYLERRGAPCAYRVHDTPDIDALVALIPLLDELGYPTDGLSAGDPSVLQRVLEMAAGRPERALVEMKVLRSLKRAQYKEENLGHFGLASDCYCHFTSPIRRYPDLIVHRLLRATLLDAIPTARRTAHATRGPSADGGLRALEGVDDMVDNLPWLCEHSSRMERVAADAAWDSVRMKLIEYLSSSVGTVFPALITGVSRSGLTVELDNTVTGFVPIRRLGDEYYEYDDGHCLLKGTETGKTWRIGRRIDARLEYASVAEMTLEFSVASPDPR